MKWTFAYFSVPISIWAFNFILSLWKTYFSGHMPCRKTHFYFSFPFSACSPEQEERYSQKHCTGSREQQLLACLSHSATFSKQSSKVSSSAKQNPTREASAAPWKLGELNGPRPSAWDFHSAKMSCVTGPLWMLDVQVCPCHGWTINNVYSAEF